MRWNDQAAVVSVSGVDAGANGGVEVGMCWVGGLGEVGWGGMWLWRGCGGGLDE